MQICLHLNPFSVSKRIQETLGRFMILQKKVCLELGREHFTVFPPPCIFLLPTSIIPIYSEELKKKKNTPLPSFQFIFYFSWKIPIDWVKKKLNVSWEHAVQDFGMGTSNEVGKGVKCVSGNSEETGSERLEIRQSFTFTPQERVQRRELAQPWLRILLSGTEGERFPASVSSTITQRILV